LDVVGWLEADVEDRYRRGRELKFVNIVLALFPNKSPHTDTHQGFSFEGGKKVIQCGVKQYPVCGKIRGISEC
jgi:hypothetical protein